MKFLQWVFDFFAGRPPVGDSERNSNEFRRGIAVGIIFTLILVLAMAAGGLSKNPTKVLDALIASGVKIDERIQRVTPVVRRNILCTAMNVLMESRGEPEKGQIAVAWVTKTRTEERNLGACDIVFEYLGAAQFSWTSYSISRIVNAALNNSAAFQDAQDVAWRVLVENEPDPTNGSNHFYAQRSIRAPAWAKLAIPGSKIVIGGHTFLKIHPNRRPWIAPISATGSAPP